MYVKKCLKYLCKNPLQFAITIITTCSNNRENNIHFYNITENNFSNNVKLL